MSETSVAAFVAADAQQSLAQSFLSNELLYGKDREAGLIAVHQISDTQVRLYKRENGQLTYRDEPFYPFFFISNPGLLSGYKAEVGGGFWLKELEGSNYYKHLAIFKSWKDYRAALDFAADAKRKLSTGESHLTTDEEGDWRIDEIYAKGDAASQYLFHTGKTLFKGMTFQDLRRMQLDIETYYDKESQQLSGLQIGRDKIIIISLADSTGWEEVLHIKQYSEKEMLERLVEIIRERDPDVIEGHNIFSFDLPYIQRRCDLYGIKFAVGRDGSTPRSYPASIRFAERTVEYPYCEIAGRHVVDTYFLVQWFDIAKRAMPSYSLKECAKYFGFATEGRTYIEHKDIAETWDKAPEKLLAYALDDVRETRKLSELLSGSNFYMTQMMPFSYAQVSRMGPAAKIEALFVREYLRHKHSIPRPQQGQQESGGFTEVFLKGILGPIVYADVESLYPSIMLTYNICPATDERRLFPRILADLKNLRLAAKARMKEAKKEGDTITADLYDAMQNSFKILINAMYGYLGFRAGIFNDYSEADRVTTTGQMIAKKMIAEFEKRGCRIVEVDTDGIYFIPPPEVQTEEQEAALVKAVSATMPEGISIAYDGRFKKMISYMKKNYLLQGYDGKIKIKGSSLVSRSAEKFGRDFVRKGFECLLNEDIAGLHRLYVETRERILSKSMHVSEFSRTETLKSSLEEYKEEVKAGRRNKAITYEIAIKKKLQVSKGDRITYYVTGSGLTGNYAERGKLASDWDPEKPDQNVDFYLKRLDEFAEKFREFFKPSDFSKIFTVDELFGFSPEGIELIKEIHHRDTAELEDEVPF
ncbi:MAG: ribonuclease H-like domain-containing protein [Chloroherpetonaceae bacterium]|nr:ribonuclease H-like domain-containing protein [Chloroherpetonaceae bacterium]